MADIQVFNHPEFGSIRTLDDGGRTLFWVLTSPRRSDTAIPAKLLPTTARA